jgi:hypothetical protein
MDFAGAAGCGVGFRVVNLDPVGVTTAQMAWWAGGGGSDSCTPLIGENWSLWLMSILL